MPAMQDETSTLIRNEERRSREYGSLDSSKDDAQNGEISLSIPTAKYWYRWYICGIFSFFGLTQTAVSNTWSPIYKSAGCALGFTSSDIDLLAAWVPVAFVIVMPFVVWMLNAKGLRLPNVLSTFLMALGTALRCLPVPVNILKYFIHAGQALIAMAGCVVMTSPPQISNSWFPPEERVTATSIMSLFSYMGMSYVIGPLIVQQPSRNSTQNGSAATTCNDTIEKHIIRGEIMHLVYLEFAVCAVIFLLMLIYFPNHPPKPPSASACKKRLDFMNGVKALVHQRTYLIVTFTFAMALGGYGGWMGVLSIILNEISISQDEAGELGFVMAFVGSIVGILVGWFADRFRGHIKLIIIILFSIAFLAFLYYMIMTQRWINVKGFTFSPVGLWITCIIIGTTMNATVPLGMEMGADAAYPTSEAVSVSVMIWFAQILSFTLLLVMQFTDAKLTNYLMLGFIGASIPLIAFFTEEPSNRMHVDMANSEVNSGTAFPDSNANASKSFLSQSVNHVRERPTPNWEAQR